jgi:hypothetical protein
MITRDTGHERAVRDAMLDNDQDTLQRIASCECCCYDHTFGRGCPAYAWGGCRGQGSVEEKEQIEGYAQWYGTLRDMTRDQFFARERRRDKS